MIQADNPRLSVARQCDLLGLARSSLYYQPLGENEENLDLMRRIDEAYTRWPFYGVRRMSVHLRREGCAVNPKRVRRLMRLMGLEAIYPRKRLSAPGQAHKRYPYLLAGVKVAWPNQVWSADITYIRLQRGFLYLAAILDWHSRYVLSWALSTTLEAQFCVRALDEALSKAQPEIFNTD
jgi:putative transposase